MTRNKRSVCVIDDEAAFLDGLSRLLEWKGYRVTAYSRAEDAIDHIQRESMDVVVSDVTMQGISGLDLVMRMRERGCSTPVVLMSARPDRKIMAKAKRCGVKDFVVKPFKPNEM
ncbi:MAG: response regulator, partial [bacterium]